MKKSLRTLMVLLILIFAPAVSFGLDVGDKEPSFNGKSTQGFVQLSDYLGEKNVVLALYFAVFTPV